MDISGEKLGISSFIRAQSVADMQAAQQREYDALQQLEIAQKKQNQLVDSLSAYVKKCFQDAQYVKQQVISPLLLQDQRQRSGVYEPGVLSAISGMGGTVEYFNITDTKCVSLVAWLQDVLLPQDGLPFTLEATPIPKLSENEEEEIIKEVQQKFAGTGTPAADIMQTTLDIYDRRIKKKQHTANKKAKNMERKIKDQMSEGGFPKAFNEFLDMLVTYPNAIMKWQIESKKRTNWENGEITITNDAIPVFRNVDPHDFFPAANSKEIEDSYICETLWYRKSDLSNMREVDGWKKEAIDRVLSDDSSDAPIMEYNYSERANLENRTIVTNMGVSKDVLRAIEVKGMVQGKFLIDWGLEGVTDANGFFQTKVILVGEEVVFAELNSNPLGRTNYYTTSFERVPGSLWGKSLPNKMKECQTGYNSARRALINNMALSSGPQRIIDESLLIPGQDPTILRPWGITLTNGEMNFNGRKAVEYVNINSQINELMAVAEMFAKDADDRSLIPRYAQGNADVGGAGQTASGLNMLMTAGDKNIKHLVINVDVDVIVPMVQDLYIYNMMNSDDESIKGDCQIVAKGAMAMVLKQTMTQRAQELLASTMNEYDMKILGLKGRANVLGQAFLLGFDGVVPSEEEIEAMMQKEAAAADQAQQMAMQQHQADQQKATQAQQMDQEKHQMSQEQQAINIQKSTEDTDEGGK